ncbi:hypothetical protein DFP73DRAFT_608354 [Morchella snyderi]|nr:hypothetical protein DFP73DRAFT_608354 [Morchella snyderi]
MAQLIGLTASIAGLIHITGIVVGFSYNYITKVKDAKREIKGLHRELLSLATILLTLKQQVDSNRSSVKHLLVLEGPLKQCKRVVEEIRVQLEPKRGTFRMIFDRARWPLLESQTSVVLLAIERYKSLFELAMSAEQYPDPDSFLAKKRAKILKWVYNQCFDEKHIVISGKRERDTGAWLALTPEFQGWVKEGSNFNILWGSGIPGAGKTFLTSRVIDDLNHIASRSPDHIGIAFVYFNYKERAQQTPGLVLCSLIHQLSSQLPTIPASLESSYHYLVQRNQTLSADAATARKVLIEILNLFKRVFLLFDALDECDEEGQRRLLIPILHELGMSGASVFVTSRSYPLDIVQSFSATSGVVTITLAAQEEDLKIYIERKIDGSPHARRLISPNVKEDITKRLVECAKGMFLLVHYFIEDICKQTTVNEIKESLQNLDSSLGEEDALFGIYQRVVQDIQHQHKSRRRLALKSLSWAVQATRTLRVDEFCQAVSVREHVKELSSADIPDISMILEVCGGLLLVDSTDKKVKPAHYSVNEYLTGKCGAIRDASKNVTTDCFTFLSLQNFKEACLSLAEYKARVELYPFWMYAIANLYNHVMALPQFSLVDLPFSPLLEACYSGHVPTFEYLCNGLQEGSEEYYGLARAGPFAVMRTANRDMAAALSRNVELKANELIKSLNADMREVTTNMVYLPFWGRTMICTRHVLDANVLQRFCGACRSRRANIGGFKMFEEVTGLKLDGVTFAARDMEDLRFPHVNLMYQYRNWVHELIDLFTGDIVGK